MDFDYIYISWYSLVVYTGFIGVEYYVCDKLMVNQLLVDFVEVYEGNTLLVLLLVWDLKMFFSFDRIQNTNL